jgi:exosortase A
MDRLKNLSIVFPFFAAALISFEAVQNMIVLWTTTDTYMHGALVLPLAAIMAFNKPLPKFNSKPISVYNTIIVSVLWSCLMIFGHLSMINVVQQFALLTTIPIVILLSSGWRVFWHYRAPIVLVFFAIPVGDFLIPYLQSITADMAMYLLRLFDVSVLRNGWYISIVSADFRVAEACSGVNFLISTFTASVFYSFTYMRKTSKRVIFIALGLFVPLVANGLRVFLIIMIAEMGYVEAATGADHIFYGWIFFVVILVMLFVLGYFMQDSPCAEDGEMLHSIKDITLPKYSNMIIVFLSIQALVSIFIFTMPGTSIGKETPSPILGDVLGPSFPYADKVCVITKNENIKEYVYQYDNENKNKKLISYENRWFNPDIWSVDKKEMSMLNLNIPVVKLSLINLRGRRIYLYTSYLIGTDWVVGSLKIKGYQALSKLMRNDFGGRAYGWLVINGEERPSINPSMDLNACSN